MKPLILLAVTVASLVACRSDPNGGRRAAPGATVAPGASTSTAAPAGAPANFEGLYAVERITKNEAACGEEGPKVESEVKHFYLKVADSFGHRILTGGGASSREELDKLIRFEPAMVYHPVVFSRGVDTAEPTGAVGESAIPEDGVCHGEAEEQSLRWLGKDRIRVEIRTKRVDYPGNEISDCGTNDSIKAAAGKPCSELIVIEARRTGPLPE